MAPNIVRAEIAVGTKTIEAYTANEPHPIIPDAFINYLSGAGMAKAIGLANNSTVPSRLSEELKGKLPEGFTTIRRTYKNSSGANSKLSLWTTDTAAVYFQYHAIKGNKQAQALVYALTATSLDIIADDQFGRQYQAGKAAQMSTLRTERVLARFAWTDVVRGRMIQLGYYGDRFRVANEFKTLTVDVNIGLFNQRHFCCDRDTMTAKQQQVISAFELIAARQAEKFPMATPAEIVERSLLLF